MPTLDDHRSALAASGLSRRGLLAGGLGVGALAVLSACGSSSEKTSAKKNGQTVTWTDARGKKIQLSSATGNVVAQSSAAAALLDAGYQVKAAYGELTPKNGKLDYQAGQLNLSDLTVIGRTYGQFDVEKYAGVDPDLLIDMCYDNKTLWYVPKNDVDEVEQLAPTLGIQTLDLDLPGMIDQFMRLSKDLGGDTEGAAVQQAKTAYDDALAAVRTAAKANPKLRVVAMSSSSTNVYFVDAEQSPDIAYLRTLGVTVPEIKAPSRAVFLEDSWERAGDHPADVILYDARVPRPTNAAWSRLPAVKAGQVFPWYAAAPYSYRSYGEVYGALAPKLHAARVLTS